MAIKKKVTKKKTTKKKVTAKKSRVKKKGNPPGNVIPQASGIDVFCSFHEIRDIADVMPNPRNPNRHPDKQIALLAKIIRDQGWRNPIVISSRSGMIVKGHGRLEAAKMLNVEKVPVDLQAYASEEEEYADMIADNRIAELAELDTSMLKDLFEVMDTGTLDLDLTGYFTEEIEEMMTENRHIEDKPEVEFTQELMECQQYVVLVFNNDIDWLQAQTIFGLKTVKALSSRPGYEKQGIGRVLDGAKAINAIANGGEG